MNDKIMIQGNVAAITGAAHGLGAAMAKRLADEGMALSLLDRDQPGLQALADSLPVRVICTTGDVSREDDLQRFYGQTMDAFGRVDLLVNNAAVKAGAGPWDDVAGWRHHFETNVFPAITLQHLFIPGMLARNTPAAIVNLGSKEGITTPPGNAAYNAGKAAIKVLTEQLAHELRLVAGGRLTAHLLIPGFTWTPMNFPGMDIGKDSQPAGAWTAEQVIAWFMPRFKAGDFYILCPDGEVTPEMDTRRITWAAQDLTENRPALSRWHPEWKSAFAEWMKG
ncbi:TPA: SDR family oxidoreductase [Klebsiella pneumoniae]|nr:SDR family oxidoreductase [Klebsiella pneumoniae]